MTFFCYFCLVLEGGLFGGFEFSCGCGFFVMGWEGFLFGWFFNFYSKAYADSIMSFCSLG